MKFPRAAKLASSSWVGWDDCGYTAILTLSGPCPSLHLCHLPDLMSPCMSLNTI